MAFSLSARSSATWTIRNSAGLACAARARRRRIKARSKISGGDIFRAGLSFLANPAEEGRAPRLHEARHDAAAARAKAGFTLPSISAKLVLEGAPLAICLGVIAQGRAALLDRLGENAADRLGERFTPGARHRALVRKRGGRAPRRKPRAKQRLAHIDIPEARDQALVEERRFQRSRLAGEKSRERLGAEFIADWLDAEPFEQGVGVKLVELRQGHEAEAAHVVVDEAPARREMEHHMIMRGETFGVVIEAAGLEAFLRAPASAFLDRKTARHAKMHDERLSTVELPHEIFDAPAERQHRGALEARGEASRKTKAQRAPAQLDLGEARAFEPRRTTTPDGLD